MNRMEPVRETGNPLTGEVLRAPSRGTALPFDLVDLESFVLECLEALSWLFV